MPAPWTPGRQFRYWREQAGLLMREVADELRVSQQALSNWEADIAIPRHRIFDLIDNAYGLPEGMTAAVCSKTNPPEPPPGDDPLVVGMTSDGALLWTVRTPVESPKPKFLRSRRAS